MRLILIIFLILSTLSCTKDNKTNFYIEYHTNGNIKKIVTIASHENTDSTVVYYYDNGHVAKVINYKNGEISPSEVTFYKTGGVYILRQYVNVYSSPSSNQIYTFDRDQNIIPQLSVFSIVNRDDESNYKLQYLTGFGLRNFNICLIDSIEENRFYCEKEIVYTDSAFKTPLFEYNPKLYSTIGIFLTQGDSITSFIFNN